MTNHFDAIDDQTSKCSIFSVQKKQEKSLEDLENEILEEIEATSSREKMNEISKKDILKNLAEIHANHLDTIQENFNDFSDYIHRKFGQAQRTAIGDAKIIKMLEEHGMTSILEQNISGLIYTLSRITGLNHKMKPELAFKARQKLLEEIEDLDRETVSEEIKEFKENFKDKDKKTKRKKKPFLEKSKKEKVVKMTLKEKIHYEEILQVSEKLIDKKYKEAYLLLASFIDKEEEKPEDEEE